MIKLQSGDEEPTTVVAIKKLDPQGWQVKEEIQSAVMIHGNGNRTHEATMSTESRTLQLKFLDEVSLPVLTGKEIEGKGGTAMRLGIVDNTTQKLVTSGPEASAKVEISLLQADDADNEHNWSTEDFNNQIIRESDKEKPHVAKGMYVRLKEGVAILSDVKLGHGSSWKKRCLCRLGAKLVDNSNGSRVKEAWTESFMVEDRRGKLYGKHYPPSLLDEVLIVDIGPIASASVEIVVLGHGTDDWTGEEFNQKIVRVEGKPPLLTVDVCKLQGGIGVLENVKFRHHAIDVKPSVFRLGARIAEKFDGIIVKEAKTESFAIKSYRCKYDKKKDIPNLSDKIWVLKNIHQRGKIEQRLQAEGIDTVEKFLIQLLINPHILKTNVAGLRGQKWEATLNHARKCESDKVYWYKNYQGNPGVVFDIFGKLQGLYSEGQFFAANMLSENKKVDADNLLSSAFENWKNVEPFDDLNSLQLYLAAARSSFEPSNSCILGHPDTNPALELLK